MPFVNITLASEPKINYSPMSTWFCGYNHILAGQRLELLKL